MKIKWTLVVIILLLMTSAAGAEGQTGASPGAFLPNQSFEFKPVPEGTKVVHEFVLKNTGAAPLRIQDIRTG